MDLVTERDDLLTEIVTEYVDDLMPSEHRLHAFAKRVTIAALLGRLPDDGVSVPVVVERSIPAAISPEASVEPVASVATAEVAEVPELVPSGETREEVSPLQPSPVPPVGDPNVCDDCGAYKGRGVCDICHPVIHQPQTVIQHADTVRLSPERVEKPAKNKQIETADVVQAAPIKPLPSKSDGREAARNYIFECLGQRKPVNAVMVGDLLGNTLSLDIRKFITQTQDEFNVKVTGKADGLKHPQDMKQAIDRNFSSLMAAVAAVGEDDEPDEEELEEIEQQAVTVAAPTVKSVTKGMQQKAKSDADRPRWWNTSAIRYCVKCKGIIVPRRYGDKQTFEAKSQYDLRKYCGAPCTGHPGPKSAESPSFRPEDEATAEAA